MTVEHEYRRCPICERIMFPVFMEARSWITLDCGHPLTLWVWHCGCGTTETQRPERCPFCVGARPPGGA